MSKTEKLLLSILSIILVISGLVLAFKVNDSFLVEVPAFGGSFSEGVVGSPRFINPILAISNTDEDLSTLIYSGLFKNTPEGLKLDLAESYSTNDDGTIYNVTIKDNAFFHDNKKLTADDIIFTVNKVINPIIKSPQSSKWESIELEKVSDTEIKFILKKPYAQFLQNLTLGILPKHIWEKVSAEEFPFSQFNVDPIGSGPYKVSKIVRNSSNIPTSITLEAWKKYTLGKPKIKSIVFKFFQNEDGLVEAYNNNDVENVAGLSPISAQKIDKTNLINNVSLPRVFGVFFNQSVAPVLLNKEVREALDLATPKRQIVNEVLFGFGKVLNGPTSANIETDQNKINGNIEEAKALLAKAGWKANNNGILEKVGKDKKTKTSLSFSISTSDIPELKQTAEILKNAWQQIGASVEIKIFEAGNLSQNVIKPRKFDALLFGEIVGTDNDLYSFWYSSERNDPGLNIAQYANITVDKNLENLQKETNEQSEADEIKTIVSEIQKDVPAIFLFSPDLLYAVAPKIKNLQIKNISTLSNRFIFVNDWYIETDKIWSFLVKN